MPTVGFAVLAAAVRGHYPRLLNRRGVLRYSISVPILAALTLGGPWR